MIIIQGIYKGSEQRPYDFTSKDGKHLIGVSNIATIDLNSVDVKPKDNLVEIRLVKDFIPVSTFGQEVAWNCSYNNKSGKFNLISEKIIKK